MGPPRYRAFLSYSTHDRAWADWLHRSLETYLVPRRLVGRRTPTGPVPRRLRPIFRDRAELAADPSLASSIETALEDSAALIVLCSPAAAGSRWVNEEIRRFHALRGPERIFAVIVAGHPREGAEDCFPAALREVVGEPIAADLRPGGDGRRLTRLKLVAGLIGVGLDELVRRDDQRRRRGLVMIAAASAAGMAVTSGLAIAALLARHEAQVRRGRAEDLVEYMLTDLGKRLEHTGRLDLMDAVGRKALAYYATEPTRDLASDELDRRSTALMLVGEVSSLRGHLDEALRSYEAASASTGEVLRRAPRDPQAIFDHAQSVFYVGEIAFQRGELAQAERSLSQYRDLAQRLASVDPGDKSQAEVGYAANALGALHLDEGRAAEAAQEFARALAVKASLASEPGVGTDRLLALGQAHAWMADAQARLGRLTEARAHRTAELAIYAKVLAADPSEADAHFSQVVAERALATLDLEQGRRAEALAGFAKAADEAERQLALEPDSMDRAGAAAAARLDKADALISVGRADEAAGEAARARSLAELALAHDPSVKLWRLHRDRGLLAQGAIAARRGDWKAAREKDEAALADLSHGPVPGLGADARWLLERAKAQNAEALAGGGEAGAARAAFSEVAQDLAVASDRLEPRLLSILAEADQRLGKAAEARALSARLAAIESPS